MQNEAGDFVDSYLPRRCSATNRIIAAKDHAAIQINIAEVDEKTGRSTGEFSTYAVCGFVRAMGEADEALARLCERDGVIGKGFFPQTSS
ncbi:small ribosomal subunit protein eS21-like [Oscarella lobularis]|uniref:small ribosomal subunit protein eS21-like n=1 Tax=Oscarella lobularis TaxID=121494 RepID=UPI0033142AC7